MNRRLYGLVVIAGALVWPHLALATPPELGTRADIALSEKRWYEAQALYKSADAEKHDPKWVLGLARAEAGAGMLIAATRHYDYLLAEIEGDASQKPLADIARLESDLIAPRLATLHLSVTGPQSAAVFIDGTPVPVDPISRSRPIDPGWHTLHVTAIGYRTNDQRVLAIEGASLEIVIALEPNDQELVSLREMADNPAPPTREPLPTIALPPTESTPSSSSSSGSTQRTLGWVGIGVGAASLTVAAFSGIEALSCQGPCAQGHTSGDVATITLVTGLVVGGLGVAMVLDSSPSRAAVSAPPSPSLRAAFTPARVKLVATPQRVGLDLTF